jgi:hypothetical protein
MVTAGDILGDVDFLAAAGVVVFFIVQPENKITLDGAACGPMSMLALKVLNLICY